MRAEPEHGLGGEAEHFAAFLAFYRATVVEKARSLPDAELRRPQVPTGWTPLELVQHLAFMERRWFVWGYLGEQVDDPWGDSQGAREEAWLVPSSVSLDDVIALLAEQAARTDASSGRRRSSSSPRPPAGSGPIRRTCATSASTCCRSTRAMPATSTSPSSSRVGPVGE